jgi:hypothetical protein
MKKFRKLNVMAVMLSALLIFGVACSDDDENPMMPAPDMGSGSELRVIHASPDAPPVDIYAEGVAGALISNLAYGENSAYLPLDAGTYNIQIRAAGSLPTSPPAFETGDLVIPDGVKISALAAGLLGSMNDENKFRVIPLVEDFTAPGAGNAAVRIVHAGADAPTVALDVGNDATVDVPNFERFGDTGVAGVALPSGTELQIAVWAGSPLERVTVFTTPQLPEGAELFVVATGLLSELPRDDDGFSLLAVAPTGSIGFIKQNPVVFALHASPNVGPVDIYAGSTILAGNPAFGELSGAIQVPPASYTLNFTGTGSPTVVASATTPTLAAGERYLAIASGFLNGNPDFRLIPAGDGFADPSAEARLSVIHASPDTDPVDVGTVAGGVLTPVPDFTNLAFEASSPAAGTVLPVGTLPIGVALTGSTDPAVEFSVPTSAGLKAFAVAAGALNPANGETLRLVVVFANSFPWTAAEIDPVVPE